MQKLEIYVSTYVYSVQRTLSMLILGGLGVCPQQKIFEN